MKKKFSKRRKKFKEEKNKIENILEGKKLKGKKLVAGVLGAALLCGSGSLGLLSNQNNTKTSKY